MADSSVSNIKEDTNDHINIEVNGNNKKLKFKIRKDTPLKKVKMAYCERTDIDQNSILFLNDEGIQIDDKHTAQDLGMGEGAIIDVYSRQTGGHMS